MRVTVKTKTILAASVAAIFAVLMIFASAVLPAEAGKPANVVAWSNGFPSGEHSNLNIHGKKLDFNCDNSGEGVVDYGSSIFVPITGTSEIDFVSNKRSSLDHLKVIDPCAAPFGVFPPIDPALVQLPTGDHQVYWRILGKPNNGNNGDPSEAMLTYPRLIDQCNFLPESFADGTIVNGFDPDVGTVLTSFDPNERYVDSNANSFFDVGEAIYRDNDSTGTVSKDDVRLANTPFPSGTIVLDTDTDISTALTGFDLNERYRDSNANSLFDVGETAYLDADVSLNVSAGDIRLANASSQGLPGGVGGDAINCDDETLVGLGLVTNTGVFKMTEAGLERFDTTSTTQGKGKSTAVNITDLFLWSGVVCDPSLDTTGEGLLTLADFPLLTEDDVMVAAIAAGVFIDDDNISAAEFQAYLVTLGCVEFTDAWVFNVADIVIYGLDYVNKGTTLTQVRFYPTSTTDFIS